MKAKPGMDYKTLSTINICVFHHQSFLYLSLIFESKADAYPSGSTYGTPLSGSLLHLPMPANIRLGWK